MLSITSITGGQKQPSTPPHTLSTRSIYRLFDGKRFARCSPQTRSTLIALARDAASHHTHELTPQGALAACLLWYMGTPELQTEATQILSTRPIPSDLSWQVKLAKVLPQDLLLELCRLCLQSSFHATAASLASAALIPQVITPPRYTPEQTRTRACDVIAQCAPQRFRSILELMCDATMQGQLDYPWLELPFKATIRLNIDSPSRQDTLRAFYKDQPFDASLQRIAKIYTPILQADYLAHQQHLPHHLLLLHHATPLITTHSRRAQHLLELAAIFEQRSRAVTLMSKLRRALARYNSRERLLQSPIPALLAKLYILHYAIEPSRVELVSTILDLAPEMLDSIPQKQLQTYLIIAQHDLAFAHLSCTYEGAQLSLIDKDPATRITYFVERHPSPRINAQIFDVAINQHPWAQQLLHHQGETRRYISHITSRYTSHCEHKDQRASALALLQHVDPKLTHFDDIPFLPLHVIERAAHTTRFKHVVAAGISGSLASIAALIGPRYMSLLDSPLMLAMTIHYCHQLCWLYGFDPAEHPELVHTIIHVTLWGPKPHTPRPLSDTFQSLEDLAIRKSLVTATIAQGQINRSNIQLIQHWLEKQSSSPAIKNALNYSRKLMQSAPVASQQPQNQQPNKITTLLHKSLPGLGMTLGALLNITLVYDLFETAQVVLADHFLARKYHDWNPHFLPSEPID